VDRDRLAIRFGQRCEDARLPDAVGYYLGGVVTFLALVIQAWVAPPSGVL
jgi:hypothetical protein